MSDEKEEKEIKPAPEQPIKKKKPDAKPEDKQASWSDHKQAELGEIPNQVKEWFDGTKLGKAYNEFHDSLKNEAVSGLETSKDAIADAAHSAKEGIKSAFKSVFGSKGSPDEQTNNAHEDENALAPMSSAEKASSPIPQANLAELDKLNPSASGTEPSPNAVKPDEDVNKTL